MTREFHDRLPSSQERAVALARTGAPAGTVVVAAEQTGGRGRADHAWWSPRGGLYLSIVARLPREGGSLLPLGVGARLARAIADLGGVDVRVKWPNDLVAVGPEGGRKVGGILLDAVPSPTLGTAAVVGVGLNVGPLDGAPPDVRARAASLADLLPRPPTLYEAEALTVREVDAAVVALGSEEGTARLLALCRERLYGVGRRASVDGRPAGTIEALEDDGALRLRGPHGAVEVRAGDLRVEEER